MLCNERGHCSSLHTTATEKALLAATGASPHPETKTQHKSINNLKDVMYGYGFKLEETVSG